MEEATRNLGPQRGNHDNCRRAKVWTCRKVTNGLKVCSSRKEKKKKHGSIISSTLPWLQTSLTVHSATGGSLCKERNGGTHFGGSKAAACNGGKMLSKPLLWRREVFYFFYFVFVFWFAAGTFPSGPSFPVNPSFLSFSLSPTHLQFSPSLFLSLSSPYFSCYILYIFFFLFLSISCPSLSITLTYSLWSHALCVCVFVRSQRYPGPYNMQSIDLHCLVPVEPIPKWLLMTLATRWPGLPHGCLTPR